MEADFQIVVDVPRSFVRITMHGFFKPLDVSRFLAARNAEHEKLRSAPNEHVTLADLRALNVQSQESAGQFARLLADPTHQSRMLAIVLPPSLARLQVARAAESRSVQFFVDVPSAERWLFAA